MSKSTKKRMTNKHGFALATVIVISCVIVILATTLISIAASSTQTTSGNLDERQAYLNAKSALDYGASYYEAGNLPEIASGGTTGEEYILMNDKIGGTTENGAEIAETTADTSDYKTYVHTTYDKAASTITLRAYAKSENMLGGQSKSTTLAVTYKVGRSSSAMGRQLPTGIMNSTRRKASDDITIHVRRDPNATGRDYFVPAIYTWSYYQLEGVSYSPFDMTIPVSTMNNTEKESNKFEPAGKWITNSSLNGPVTKMTQDPLGNDWFQHTFSPSKAAEDNRSGSSMVPWFSMIVSHQSSELNIGNKEDGTQSCEFLNVWYLDENDKNIYVEIKKSPLYYYKNSNWNGKTNLQDRLIAYANSAQTVYYAKVKGNTTDSVKPTITISGHGSGTMSYSGYGWWSYRAEDVTATDYPSVTISGTGISTVTLGSVKSGSSNSINGRSAYIAIDPSAGSARSCVTEEAAAIALDDEDYVTVYAKSFVNGSQQNPSISYLVETHGDSKAKQRLLAALKDADQLYEGDYDSASWSAFITVVNAAKDVYNNSSLQANEVYNEQTQKIADAKADLSYSSADVTNLEAAIASANSKNADDYTYESYSAMITIRDQAQTLVDEAKAATSVVRQSAIDAKEEALNKKISELDPIASYRDQLILKLEEAYAAQAANPSSPNIGALNSAVSAGEALKTSNRKTEIEAAITNITNAISRVTSSADTAPLVAAINAAQLLIDDSDLFVPGTITNLQNIVDQANNALNTTTMIQSEVDAYVTAIYDAIHKLIYIPIDRAGEVESGKRRIWFDTTDMGTGNYYIYAWYDKGGSGKQNIAWCDYAGWENNPQVKLKLDTGVSPYYYYDLEEKYQNFIIIRCQGGNVYQTVNVALNQTNNFYKISSKTKYVDSVNKNEVEAGQLATIYSSGISPWGSSVPYGTLTTGTNITDVKFTAVDANSIYYMQRVVFENSTGYYIHKELAAGETATGNKRTVDISLSIKPIVVLYPELDPPASSYVNVTADTLDKIMNTTPVTTVNAAKSASATVTKTSSKNIVKVDTSTGVYVDTHIPSEPIITIYFLKPSSWSSNVKAEIYQRDNSGNIVGIKQTNKTMMTDDGSYYYLTVDSNIANTIMISDGNTSSKRTSAVTFAVDSSSDKYYATQLVSMTGSNTQITMFTSPQAVLVDQDVSFPNTQKQLKMAYVGGKKKIFENVPDSRNGRKDMCGAGIGGTGKFNNTGDQGYARVGFSRTKDYYDWYEYKIPAGETDLYTIEIKGLGSSPGTVTKQIHQIWGNIWVSLSSDTKTNGKYTDVSVATVNPEDNITQEKTKIYIDIPTWAASNGGLKVTMWGTASKTETLSDTYDGRYVVEVPQNMPFLQISSVNGMITLPKTKLQGGDKIRYKYNAGLGGTPDWVTYVPANIALQRELANAESVANGWALYEYHISTHAADTANAVLPYKLMNMALSTNPENQSTNPNADQARANELAKWTLAYKNLYEAITNARAYLTMDDAGNAKWYPENENLATGASYAAEDIKNLYSLAKNAIAAYGSTSVSLSTLVSYADQLEAARNDMKADVTEKAIFLLDDVAGWNNNIKIRWTDSNGNNRETNVTSKNIDGDPLVYIDCPTTITNVAFGYGTGSSVTWGSAKDSVSCNQEWVYCNSPLPEKAGWNRNSPDNYFSYSSKSYTQNNAAEEKLVGEMATADDFILYFDNNLKVTYKEASSERSYTIPAGAYYVNIYDYRSYYTGVSSPPDKINLYSRTAEGYFTNPVNQGLLEGASYSDDIGWTSSGNIVSHANRFVHTDDVNFVASSGTLNGIYQTSGVISFRWNSTSDLRVQDNTSFTATTVKIATTGDISGGSTISPEFLIKSKGTGEKTTVTFLTNTTIKYVDSTGQDREFDISQGTYETIHTDTDINIFDEDFWNSEIKMVATTTGSGNGGFLSDPVYSVD